MQATLCAQATQDELIIDSTRSGAAWTYANVSGNTWRLSEPVAMQVVPYNGLDQPEQDTWANGDAYQVVSLPTVYLADVELAGVAYPPSPDGGQTWASITISHVSVPQSGLYQSVIIGGGVITSESRIIPTTAVAGHTQAMTENELNCDLGMVSSPTSNTQPPFVKGGIMRITMPNIVHPQISTGIGIETSAIVAGGELSLTGGQVDDVYIESGAQIDIGLNVVTGGNTISWGPGILNVSAPGNLFVNGTAASHLLNATIQVNFLGTACAITDAGAVSCGRPITAAAIDAPAIADGGFGGGAFSPAGASITTTSSPF